MGSCAGGEQKASHQRANNQGEKGQDNGRIII